MINRIGGFRNGLERGKLGWGLLRRGISTNHSWLSMATMIAIVAAGWLAAGLTPTTTAAVDVPANLRADGPVMARVKAKGFQVYTCKPDATGKLAWTLKAPDATFEGDHGLTGRHYAGPTWESIADGSKVVGKKLADDPSPDADAVPWLLLGAASHEGAGLFSNVTYIQRINTSGGKAPPVGEAKEGDECRVPYTAEYIFYGPGTTTRPKAP